MDFNVCIQLLSYASGIMYSIYLGKSIQLYNKVLQLEENLKNGQLEPSEEKEKK
jgi:hypothetical protein